MMTTRKISYALALMIMLIPNESLLAQAKKSKKTPAKKSATTAKRKAAPKADISKQPKTVGDLLKGLQDLQKTSAALPKASTQPVRGKNMQAVKPLRSSAFLTSEDQNEVELEKAIDDGINELFKLSNRYSKSPNRGELWLRLAEMYVEKARLLGFRAQSKFDKEIAQWEQAGRKGDAPKIDLKASRSFNMKAIQLYEWFLADFPNDKKVDQALFFLGYNYVEMDQVKKGVQYYERLTKNHPRSPYVSESHFALGEYYFDNNNWKKAQENYDAVLRIRNARLYAFALYKMGWCLYRQGRIDAAIQSMEQVVAHSKRQVEISQTQGLKSVNRIRLATEALKDLVPFYADIRPYQNAKEYFLNLGGEKAIFPLLERLAYVYSDLGKQDAARYVFKQLLEMRPTAPKAFDYQYQIVQNYSDRGSRDVFRQELFDWIKSYSPNSDWARTNQNDAELLKKAYELRESTLRNYTLQQHQTAQNSRSTYSQRLAREGYNLYLAAFKDAEKIDEMHFFFGELLYDMREYAPAADHYQWVVDNKPQSKYYEQASINWLLALEKLLPTDEMVAKQRGESLNPVAYGEAERKFQSAAERYIKNFPKGQKVPDIRFKLARMAYSYNQFDEALERFQYIVDNYPKTQYAVFSANLILDIYNLRKDYEGLAKVGSDMLEKTDLKGAGVNLDIQDVVEKANFKKAQDAEVAKNYTESAKLYDGFSAKYPNSKLAPTARYNAGVNYERAGMTLPAIAMYRNVVEAPKNRRAPADVTKKANRLLARLYEQTGQYERAASEYERYARENPKDTFAGDANYNAAIIWESVKSYSRAVVAFEAFYNATKRKDRNEALYLIAQVNEKRGSISAAINFYEQFISTSPSDGAKLIDAHYKVAVLSKRLGRVTKAKESFEKVIAIHKKISKVGGFGTTEAAEAKFHLTQGPVQELVNLKIPRDPAKQQPIVKRKLDLLAQINKDMAEVIKFDDAYFVVAALTTLGKSYEHMSKSLYEAPLPAGLNAEEQKEYKAGIENIAGPLKQTAIENYQNAITKGHQIFGYTEQLQEAMNGLNRYQPGRFPFTGEKVHGHQELDFMGI